MSIFFLLSYAYEKIPSGIMSGKLQSRSCRDRKDNRNNRETVEQGERIRNIVEKNSLLF